MCPIYRGLVESPDYRALYRVNETLGDMRNPPFTILKKNGEETGVYRARSKQELLDELIERARKAFTIQRYKGLGEMNPQQLWETTMDPERRTLLQVRLEDAVAAEEIFSILMGDSVEPRKEFIRSHALEVRNLDV